MGVHGLWDIVHKAGQSTALTHLAVSGFESNKSGKRAYRIGIDASIWYAHASFSKGGENPELRLLFYRLRSLAQLPFLPLFVFDGRERPKFKRGSKMGKAGSHHLTAGFKKLLDLFGMEWRVAIGEAEAELCHLNQLDVIDAIMTDDVDALVFGAVTIIKNTSLTLTGNKSKPALDSKGKPSKHHVWLYTADAVRNHPDVALTRGGLVLIALLSGGDYDDGVDKFGPTIAHGLARCGFGDQLVDIFNRRTREDIQPLLARWRNDIHDELRTNSHGFLSRKSSLCRLPPEFPNIEVVHNYIAPLTSARNGGRGGGAMRDNGDPSLPRLAAFCEVNFGEWGHESAIIKRFRDLIWPSAIMRVLRRAALEADEKEKTRRIETGIQNILIRGPLKPTRGEAIGTPMSLINRVLDTADTDRIRDAFVNRGRQSNPLEEDNNASKMKIVGSRRHVSTDHILEYRVELMPSILVTLARKGIQGKRSEPTADSAVDSDPFAIGFGARSQKMNSPKKPPPDPDSSLCLWIPACIVEQAHPGLVEDFESPGVADKPKVKRKGKGKGKAKAQEAGSDHIEETENGLKTTGMALLLVNPSRPQVATQHMYINYQAVRPSSRNRDASLPALGRSDFLFWIPNPDDPDMLIIEDAVLLPTKPRTSHASCFLPRAVHCPENPSRSITAPTLLTESARPRTGRNNPQAKPRIQRHASQTRHANTQQPDDAGSEQCQDWSDSEHNSLNKPTSTSDAATEAFHDAVFDSIMGPADGSRPPKARPRAKRPRIPPSDPPPSSGHPSPTKKRKLTPPLASFPVLEPLSVSVTSSPGSSRTAPILSDGIIEIFSDSEGRYALASRGNQSILSSSRRDSSRYRLNQPGSSQDSGLYSDAMDFIDLTL